MHRLHRSMLCTSRGSSKHKQRGSSACIHTAKHKGAFSIRRPIVTCEPPSINRTMRIRPDASKLRKLLYLPLGSIKVCWYHFWMWTFTSYSVCRAASLLQGRGDWSIYSPCCQRSRLQQQAQLGKDNMGKDNKGRMRSSMMPCRQARRCPAWMTWRKVRHLSPPCCKSASMQVCGSCILLQSQNYGMRANSSEYEFIWHTVGRLVTDLDAKKKNRRARCVQFSLLCVSPCIC